MGINGTTRDGLVSPVELALPELPAELEGLRIVHVTDLHIKRRRRLWRRVGEALAGMEMDLLILTGDYMFRTAEESFVVSVMREMLAGARPRLGTVGVWGNHDSARLRRLCSELPVRWLNNACYRPEGLPLRLMGVETWATWLGDSMALLEDERKGNGHQGERREMRFLLSHYPMYLPVAADMGMDVMFSGHTHGGQCRIPPGKIWVNSTDYPMHLSSGVLRHRETVCVVSRGLGESILPVRLFCPPHIPVYTLRRGEMHGRKTDHVENVEPW